MPYEYEVCNYSEDRCYKITANKTQEKLYSEWEKMIDTVGKVDGVFLLGDLIDGTNQKGVSMGLSNADLNWQQEMAIDLIKMIPVKYGNYYAVQGSAYHTGNNGGQDYGIAKALTREAHSKFVFGDDILVDIEDIKIHARHVTSYTKNVNLRQNSLSRDVLEALSEGKRTGKIDIFLRGHTHSYAALDYKPYFSAHVCPCWKGRDSFISQRSILSPDCGYMVIDIDRSDYEVTPHIFKV